MHYYACSTKEYYIQSDSRSSSTTLHLDNVGWWRHVILYLIYFHIQTILSIFCCVTVVITCKRYVYFFSVCLYSRRQVPKTKLDWRDFTRTEQRCIIKTWNNYFFFTICTLTNLYIRVIVRLTYILVSVNDSLFTIFLLKNIMKKWLLDIRCIVRP